MNITIIGSKTRASAWEKHLRKLSIVKQVVITSAYSSSDNTDAVLVIDNSNQNLDLLLDIIKKGKHCYLVSKLPTDPQKLETIYHSAEEANVKVKFSHWPSIAPSTHWIKQQIPKPELVECFKETIPVSYSVDPADVEHGWVDEVGLMVKWFGGNVHKIEAKPIVSQDLLIGISITLRFENRSVATISYSAVAENHHHIRKVSGDNSLFELDVKSQNLRITSVNEKNRIVIKSKSFDPTDAAEWSVIQFIKSIQVGRSTIFNAYDALQTAAVCERIKTLI